MTWQSYVDRQICDYVDCKLAIIASLADGSIWAKKEQDLSVSQQELKVIVDTLKSNPKLFLERGIHLAGEKYICITADDNLVRGRRNSAALCIVATKTCLLVTVSLDGFPAGVLNTVVEGLGDYLVQNNF